MKTCITNPPTFKPITGTPTTVRPPLALFSQFQCVLQPTRPFQYVGISRVTVALTAHLNVTKSMCVVHVSPTLPL